MKTISKVFFSLFLAFFSIYSYSECRTDEQNIKTCGFSLCGNAGCISCRYSSHEGDILESFCETGSLG